MRSEFRKSNSGFEISSSKIPCLSILRQKGQSNFFLIQICPKINFGVEILEIYVQNRNQLLQDARCAICQAKWTTLTFLTQICSKMDFGPEFQKSKSGFGIIMFKLPFKLICRQNKQLWIFQPKFGEFAQSRAIFGSYNVEVVGEGWVEVKISWMELVEDGWSWLEVDGRYSNTHLPSTLVLPF